MADSNKEKEKQPAKGKIYHCSFCGTSSDKAFRLIAGPKKAFICDDCVKICMEILRDEGGFWCPFGIPNRKPSYELSGPKLYKPQLEAGEYINDILFLSPQNDLSQKLFTSQLKPFAKKYNLKIKNITNTAKEMKRVDGELLEIHNASLILIDITDQSPFIMFLFGMITLIGKPYIILRQDKTEIPRFCFGGRVFCYEKNSEITPDFVYELRPFFLNIQNFRSLTKT